MTKKEVFEEINRIQDSYDEELIELINDPEYEKMKAISFTSPTGTGKTKMMAKLINKCPQFYYIVTTLSKGQLHIQVRNSRYCSVASQTGQLITILLPSHISKKH